MTTYLLRHARTSYSARYLVNGDSRLALPLDQEGIRSCHAARRALPAETHRCPWAVSSFPRTQQTAALLSGDPDLRPTALPQLDELDYGIFEGGPFLDYAAWLRRNGAETRPPSASESQHEGIRRMLFGVRATLAFLGPRVIVAHGLLLSVLAWDLTRPTGTSMPLLFSEAPYLASLRYTDEHLDERTAALLSELAEPVLEQHSALHVRDAAALPAPGSTGKSDTATDLDLANVGALSIPSEEQSPHA
ncbi:histidine phosphatase family protein [Streptomyces sp. NPDC001340]